MATGDLKGFDLDHGGFASAGRPVAGPGFAETVRIRVLAPLGARRANHELQALGDTAHEHPERGASVAGGYRGHGEAGAGGLRATAAGLDRVMQELLAAIAGEPGALRPPTCNGKVEATLSTCFDAACLVGPLRVIPAGFPTAEE